MGRRPNNWKVTAPPPSMDDLKFQSESWYARYSHRAGPHLSPGFNNGVFRDKTLTWEIGNRISGAAAILLREDDDSVC